MFRTLSKVALVVVLAFGSLAVVTAEEPKEMGDKTKNPPKELSVDLGKGIKLEMVLIPAGEFMMGSPDSDKDAEKNEKPQHRVRITNPFYMGKYLVTQEQWEAVMGDNPSYFKGPKNPVETVSWDDCQKLLEKLNAKVGTRQGKFVLPTEAQWEYACRAGSTTRYYFGDDKSKLGEYAWYEANSDTMFFGLSKQTHPVGKKKPNAWGLYDMHGNVCEWCQDFYDSDYYANSPVDDPSGPTTSKYRMVRGGTWHSGACRSADHGCNVPDRTVEVIGLRVALILADKVPTTAEPSPAPTPTPLKQITNSIGMKLTLVPSGEFMMGSRESAEETAAFFKKHYEEDVKAKDFKNEHPQHRVRITKPFYFGTYHVTRGQFRQFFNDTGYKTDAENREKPGAYGWNPDNNTFEFSRKYSWRNAGFEQTDEHPVVNVSWNDAIAFCKWLSKKEGKTYRLPTEAAWEYACRAGTTTRYYSGDDPQTLLKISNVTETSAKAKVPAEKDMIKASHGYLFTSQVGSFKPNAFGLYDMYGNVWQFCSDRYDEEYYVKSPENDPTGPESGDSRVLRGGSWPWRPSYSRSAFRYYWVTPTFRNYQQGFRIAWTQ